MNDFLDGTWIYRHIDTAYPEFKLRANIEQIKTFETAISYFKSTNIELPALSPFVACFSSNGDVLSQWRSYSENGFGFSIGFSTEEMQNHLKKQLISESPKLIIKPFIIKIN